MLNLGLELKSVYDVPNHKPKREYYLFDKKMVLLLSQDSFYSSWYGYLLYKNKYDFYRLKIPGIQPPKISTIQEELSSLIYANLKVWFSIIFK